MNEARGVRGVEEKEGKGVRFIRGRVDGEDSMKRRLFGFVDNVI